jgi:hypothetical protein
MNLSEFVSAENIKALGDAAGNILSATNQPKASELVKAANQLSPTSVTTPAAASNPNNQAKGTPWAWIVGGGAVLIAVVALVLWKR